jgi:hypothetical protein
VVSRIPGLKRVENTAEGENCGGVQEFLKAYGQ